MSATTTTTTTSSSSASTTTTSQPPPTKKQKTAAAVLPKGECNVCYDELVTLVECGSCDYRACSKCTQQYLMTKATSQCMKCGVAWPPAFVYANFTKSWIEGDYRKAQKAAALDRERALLPEAMAHIQRFTAIDLVDARLKQARLDRVAAKKKYTDLKVEIEGLEYAKRALNRNERIPVAYHRIDPKVADALRPVMDTLGGIHRAVEEVEEVDPDVAELLRATAPVATATTTTTSTKEPKVQKFICPCPHIDASDGQKCRGLIASSGLCAVCTKRVCRRCREPELELQLHVCLPENIATVEMLKKDTKPCPVCCVLIHKTFGCSQMACTNCYALFDWNTMKIDTGPAHNPYYLEYQRKHGGGGVGAGGGNVDPCGARMDIHTGIYIPTARIFPLFDASWKYDKMLKRSTNTTVELLRYNTVEEMWRLLDTLRESVSTHGHYGNRRDRPEEDATELQKLRVKYATKEITEEKWSTAVFVRSRSKERKQLIRDVLTTMEMLLRERFRAFSATLKAMTPVSHVKTHDSLPFQQLLTVYNTFIGDVTQMCDFSNSALQGLKLIGVKKPLQIDTKTFRLVNCDVDNTGAITPAALKVPRVTTEDDSDDEV